MIRYFKLADVVVRVGCDIDLPLQENEERFLVDECDYDYDFEFIEDDRFREVFSEGKMIYEGPFYHIYDYKGYEVRAFFTDNYYYGVSYIGEDKGCFYFVDRSVLFKVMSLGPMQLLYLCFEKILLKHGGVILHSSYVNYNDNAILFSAPSGTGKSTQAELWRKYKGAEVVNGDRTALRYIGGEWIAYGIPMSGTSGICLDKKMPLSSIVVIRQSKMDSVRKLSIRESFRCLFSEISINNWNRDEVDKVINILSDLIEKSNIYLLECTKEESAVNCLYDFLKEGFYGEE
ncbi:MAG: hypothetical protein ACI4PU_04325 [Intestinibacter sp.]